MAQDIDFSRMLDELDEAPAVSLGEQPSFDLPGSTRKLIDEAVGAREADKRQSDYIEKGKEIISGIADPQQYVEFGKGIVPGGVSFIGTAIQSPDAVAARGQQGAAKFGRKQLEVMDRIDRGESVPEMEDPTGYAYMSTEQRAAARAEQQRATAEFNPTPIEKRPFFQTGEKVQKYAKELMPAAKGYEESVGRQLGEGMGSMVFGLPFAYFGAVPAGIVFGGAGIGEATQRAVDFDRKEKAAGRAGLTEDQISLAGILGVGPGATDLLPVEMLMGRLPIPVPPALKRPLAMAIGRIGGQAFVEGVQEGGQAFLQNLIAREVYNPEQKLIDGIEHEIGIGAGVGGIAQTAKEVGSWMLRSGAIRKKKGVHDSLVEHEKAKTEAAEQAATPEDTRTLAPSQEGPTPRLKPGEGSVRGPSPAAEPAIQDAERLLAEIGGETIAQPSKPEEDDGTAGAPAAPAPTPSPVEGGAAAPVPTFNDIMGALPRDSAGDPDLAPLIETLQGRPYNTLTDAEKIDLVQRLRGEAPTEARGAVSQPEAATPAPKAEPAATAQPASLTEALQQAAPQIEEAVRQAVAPVQETAQRAQSTAIGAAERAKFAEVLATKEKRSNWGAAAGLSEQQIQALTAEAVADGRLRMLKGNVVRTAKARAATPASPLAAEAAEATTVPMGRAAERRLEAIQDATAYRHAAKLLGLVGKPRKLKAALKDAKKALKRGQADQIFNALVPGAARPKNVGLVFDAIEQALGEPNAVGPALRDDARPLPEGGLSEGIRPDGEVGRAPDAPRDDLGGSVGDVGRSDGADADQPGPAGGLPGAGEGARVDAGTGARTGERGTDTPAAPVTGLTDEQKAEVEAQVRTDAEKLEQVRRDRERLNYQITDADEIGKGGPKAKVRGNIAAIKKLREIEETGREATEEDKRTLVKYVGWGAFAQDVFTDYKSEWKAERDQIKDLLSPAEYAAARASTLNAHYTSPEVIRAMWDGLKHLGFKGGRALEPAAGIGHYIGLTPSDLRSETAWTAVELDPISAGITKALYGAADVRSAGFETQKWPDDFFDLAVSNVPFGNFNLEDADTKGFLIHDYFFIKSLAKVRPGGVVAFITSAGTLDKENGRARTAMSRHAKFLGAVRLPGGNQGAFKGNAGTEVTTDIIFFRKRVPGEPAEETHDWRSLTEIKTPEGPTKINSYFAANPDMMLGKMRLKGTMYSAGEPVLIGSTENLGPKILEAIQTGLPENAMLPKNTTAVELSAAVDTATDGIKEGSFYEKDGVLYRKVIGVGQPQKFNATDKSKVRAFIGIRNVVNQMLAKQSTGDTTGMAELRDTLTKAYDAFVKAHGPINQTIISQQKRKDGKEITVKRQPTLKLFEDDPDAFKVSAIEVYDEKTGKAKKAAIFTEDIVGAYVAPDVKGPSDALAVSLNERGKVDLELIASRLGVSEAEAIVSLGDQIYLSPNGEQWQTRAEYLSGDVVEKLEVAKVAAELDPGRYLRNVEALEAVQPEPLTRQEITIPFGAPWVPAEVYQDFLRTKLGATYNIKVSYNEKNARWTLISGGFNAGAQENFGTSEKSVEKIIEHALNSDSIVITHKDSEGNAVRQPEAEQEARARVDAIRELFSGDPESGVDGWVWEDEARAERLEAMYNRNYNRLVPQNYDGSHLTFPGLARVVTFPDGSTGTIDLQPHRVSAIWRIIQKGNTLLNHVVGSGKTWTSIMAAMEMKRLGMIQRPMFVVPNHMLNQFSTEFYQAYPNAKLLIATKDQMSSKRRREFAAKAAADKWDGIIITHSAFTRIGMQPEAYKEFYAQQIEEFEASIEAAVRDEGAKSKTVKELEKAKKRLETKLKALTDEESKDVGVTFEELGVDHLTVDEAHLFKSLQFATRHTRVKGISNKGESKRATDLFIKMRHLEKSRPGRSAVFLTGTPVSNTMAELFTMQRYLQEGTLRKYGIAHFDSWAATFGKIVTKSELGSDSRTYKDTESFSQFVNMPELMAIVGDVMDTQTADMLKLPRPNLRKGKIDVVEAELSPLEQSAIDQLVYDMENRDPKDPFLPLFTRGIQLATDMRLVDPSAPFNPKGKIGLAVDNIFSIWTEGNADPKAPNKAQIVFLDMGVPGSKGKSTVTTGKAAPVEAVDIAEQIRQDLMAEANAALGEDADGEVVEIDEDAVEAAALLQGKFNLYQDIKDRLIEKGVPAEQIAFIHDAKNDDQKAKMFEKVRAGEIRVLIGSTGKMGVGTNVQRQLIAMHHLDAPWKPADVEQRDGRILRRGNKNPEVRILRYITKKSFDAYRWQLLDRKSNFIGQLYAGALGVRNAEDIDPPLPEAAELKAAATGNPLIVERAELEREVRVLEAAERAHLRGQKQAAVNAGKVRTYLATATKFAEAYEADAQLVTDLSGDNFTVDLEVSGGRTATVTERKKAGEAVRAFLLAMANRAYYGRKSDVTLGRISGFEMAAEVERSPDGFAVRPMIAGRETYRPNEPFLLTETSDPIQLIRRWEKLVGGVVQHVENVKATIAKNTADLPKLEEAARAKPFGKAGQLVAKRSRLDAVVRALDFGKGMTPEEMEAQASYVDQAMANLRATSRTAAGVVDTSASAGKAGQMAEGLTAESAARSAVENFESTIRDIYRRRDQFATMTPEALADEADKIAIAINKGILKEGALYRADDSKKFPYTAVADLMTARTQFFEELARRLQDPNADPIETAAYIEWRANLGDHFWADGVGKTSKALAYIPLMRAGMKLPKYKTNKEFFSYSRKVAADPNKGPAEYLGPEFDRFLDYYRSLMGKPDTTPEGYARREAAAREIMASDAWVRATIPDMSAETINKPGYGTPEWRESRVYNTRNGEVVGYEAGIKYLIDEAAAKIPGELKQERKLFLLLGKPGSGKSTIAQKIGERHGAMHLVGDDAKLIIPEYNGGKGSGAVHEEASEMMKDVQKRMMVTGNNIIIEKLGSSDGSVLNIRDAYSQAGYKIIAINVDVPMALSLERAIGRWHDTGRAVPQAEFDRTALNLPGLMTKLRNGGLANETATVRFSEAADRWELLDPGLETEGLWDRAGAPERELGVVRVGRDQGPDRGRPGSGRGTEGQEGLTPEEEGASGAPLAYQEPAALAAAPPADSYALRTLNALDDPVLKGHYQSLIDAGTNVEGAVSALASDRRLDDAERQQIAEAYVGGVVAGDPVQAVRDAAAERSRDITSALLGGFVPEVSPSNLRVRDDIVARLQEMAQRLPQGSELAIKRMLRVEVGGRVASLEGEVRDEVRWDGLKKILAVSLEYGPDVALRTFTHEEIHLLRQMGVINDKEWAILSGIAKRRPKKPEAERIINAHREKMDDETFNDLMSKAGKLTYRDLYKIDARYEHLSGNENKLVEETVAWAAGDWAQGRQFAAPIERAFQRIRDFLEAIQNALNGLGFRSANDIFESIWAGELTRKFEEAAERRFDAESRALDWMNQEGITAMAIRRFEPPAITEVWGTKFQTLMSEQYQIAVAGEDYATQYDILSAKYNNALSDPPEMREAMKAEIDRLRPIVEAQEAQLREELKRKFSRDDGGSAPPILMAAFAGEKAKTADLEALTAAKRMDAEGATREAIWHETGWFRGVDGRWRFEIDDSKSRLRLNGPDFSMLHAELTHDPLFDAYPELVEVEFNRVPGAGGEFMPGGIVPSTISVGKSATNRRSIALHEAQHAIQDMEMFAEGGNSDAIRMTDAMRAERWARIGTEDTAIEARLLMLANPRERTSITRELAYRMLAGEVESRTVQKRMNYTADEREDRPPWLDYDVPEDQQIVRMPDGSGPRMMASVDESTGQSMRRDLDALGYYSQALEAAKTFQNKGTPEQALAWLKKNGVKDAELEATGMWGWLSTRPNGVVTRDDLVKHLEGNRVGLTEVRRSKITHDPVTGEQYGPDDLDDLGVPYTAPDYNAAPKFSYYSLDPDNPTYRETVLHLPATEPPLTAKDAWGAVDLPPSGDFRSGHFPEPNIIGHMMTSMTTHQGKPVYTIDQIQSDWGQKIRDGGVKDEASIPGLKAQLKDLQSTWKAVVNAAADKRPNVDRRDIPGLLRSEVRRGEADEFGERLAQIEPEMSRIEAELRTAESGTIGNPLVNTTDQWVNTTLRRAIRQAVEADAEYIAIPTGDTVLSYNPGDTKGMRQFYGSIAPDEATRKAKYDAAVAQWGEGSAGAISAFRQHADRTENVAGIVPKNLRNLLQKIDKQSPAPERIETLDSPSGKTGLGQGFTLFPLTEKVKQSVMEEGQPMFALRSWMPSASKGAALPPMDNVDLGFVGSDSVKARYDELRARETALEDSLPREVWSFAYERRFNSQGMLNWVTGEWANEREKALRPLIEQHKDTIDAIRVARREVDKLGQELDGQDLAERLAVAAKEPRPADEPMMVYHGTGEKFEKYSGEVARSKSDAARDIGMDAMFVTPRREFAERFGDPIPLTLDAGFYFSAEDPRDLARLAPFINSRPNPKRVWQTLERSTQSWGLLESREFAEEIKRLGYDGVKMTEEYYDAKDRKRVAPTLVVFTEGKVSHRDSGQPMFALRDWITSKGTGRSGPTPPQSTPQGESPGLNKIISDLKKTLGMPVSQGLWGMTVQQGARSARIRPPSNVNGQFDRETGNVSIRQSRDIKTLAHEGGHYLESILGADLGAVKQRFAEALTGDPNPMPAALSEGFARWFETYILDPQAAETRVPGMTEAFDELLEAERPDMLAAFDTIQQEYQRYVTSAPIGELAAGLSSQYDGTTWRELSKDKALDNVSGKLSSAYEGVIDSLNVAAKGVQYLLKTADANGIRDADGRPISIKVGDNFYKRLRMFAGSFTRGRVWLDKGVSDLETGQVIGPSLKAALEKALGDGKFDMQRYKDFNQYLVSIRALAEYDRLDQKKNTVKQYDDTLAKLADARPMLAERVQRDAATLDRRQDALTRANAMLADRRRMLGAAETRLENIQERLDGVLADIAEAGEMDALAQEIADPTAENAVAENYAAMASRRRRQVQNLERQQREAVRAVERLSEEVTGRDVEVGMLQEEIRQMSEGLARGRQQIAQLDDMSARMRREREAANNRGASRPPTAEPRAVHERVIRELGTPEFQEAAQMVHDFTFSLLEARRQAGFIPQELFDELAKRKDWYVPFWRDMSDIEGAGAMFPGSGVKKWSMFKKFDGSDRSILMPLEILSEEAYSTAQQIAFNEAVKAMINLAERVGPGGGKVAERLARTENMEANEETFGKIRQMAIDLGIDPVDAHMITQRMEMNFSDGDIRVIMSPENLGPTAKPQLPLWENGERVMIRLPDPAFGRDLFEAINGLGKDMSDILVKALALPAQALRVGVTSHPDFMFRNMWRDIWTAWKLTGAAPFITQYRGFQVYNQRGEVDGMAGEDFLRLYNEAGGIAGGINVNAQIADSRRDVKDLLDTNISYKAIAAGAALGGFTGVAAGSTIGSALGLVFGGPVGAGVGFKIGASIGGLVGGTGVGYMARHGEVWRAVESVETATRLGVAAHAYKRAKAHNPDLSDIEAIQEAAFVSRDIMDWNRRGSKMLAATRLVTFLNAQIQGLDKQIRQMSAQGDRGSVFRRQLELVFKHQQPGALLSRDEQRDLADAYKSYLRWGAISLMLMGLYALYQDDDDYQDIKDETKWTHSWFKALGIWFRLPKPFELAVPSNIGEIIWDKIGGRDQRMGERIVDSMYEVLAPPGMPQIMRLTGGILFNRDRQGIIKGRSREIVGENLASRPPHERYHAFTSELAIDLSRAMYRIGVPQSLIPAPVKTDFVLSAAGAYWGREVQNSYQTAKTIAGMSTRPDRKATDFPILRGFTGEAARVSRSVNEMFEMMSREGGEMTMAATEYKQLMDERGRPAEAETWLAQLDEEQRVWTLTQYYGSRSEKREHPLQRAKDADAINREIMRDTILDQVAPKRRQGRKQVRDFEEQIVLTPAKKLEVIDILARLSQIEARNTMILLKRKGFEGIDIKDPEPIMDELKAASPEVFDLLQERRDKKVADWPEVMREWPRYRDRVLKDLVNAF